MKRTPLYYAQLELGATMNPMGNWPLVYPTGIPTEHMAVRERAGFQDLSSMPQILVQGPDAGKLLDLVLANDAGNMKDGQMIYSSMLDEYGTIVDDGTLWRRSRNEYVSLPTAREPVVERLKLYARGMDAHVADLTSGYGGPLALQGPKSKDILQKLTDYDLSKIRWFWGADATVAGFPCIIDRGGYTGENGFELHPRSEDAVEVWNAVLEAGKEFGCIPIGLSAMGTLRIEKGLIGGSEYRGSNPFECGLDRFVKLEKDNFIGKDALLKIKREGVKRKVMGLVIEGKEPVKGGDAIVVDGESRGKVTTACYGHFLKKNIAMCMVEPQYAVEGLKATVATAGGEKQATVTTSRQYDPAGERLRRWG